MKSSPSRTFIAASCTGKEAFSTPQLANKVLRRRGKLRRNGKREQHVYHCTICGLFHIGRPTKSVYASTRREQALIEEDEVDMT